VTNPIDMIASASAESFGRAIRVVADDPNVDALVVIFIPPLVTKAEDVAREVAAAVQTLGRRKPVAAVFMQSRGVPEALRGIPSYAFPESAAIALARAARYAEWRARPVPAPVTFADLRKEEAAAVMAGALARGGGWLTPDETHRLLACYGLPRVDQKTVTGAAEAAEASRAFGVEVALKAVAPGVVHKTEFGAVRLNLKPGDAVRRAAEEMEEALRSRGHPPTGFIVQPMIPKGVEMIVGVVHDPQFGPVVAVGAGGVMVELLRDVSVRLAPLSRDDAAEMVRGLKSHALLKGVRGGPTYDTGPLEDVLLRVGMMVEDLPQIVEMDCNPIIVHERGATIADARVRAAAVEAPLPIGARK
jgi:acyl-CoA synthetase (NDP forming)